MENLRYGFGRNWHHFITSLTDEQIEMAQSRLEAFVGPLADKRFLDIGSGSGLHSLAALRLGAAQVTAIDYDPDSVKATTALLDRFAPGGPWKASQKDILKSPLQGQAYDIVYSWGVLHHTGDMWKALECASRLSKEGGLFAIALYIWTTMCRTWLIEKRLYCRYPVLRPLLESTFIGALLLRITLSGNNPIRHVAEYKSNRGMNFFTDVLDWLGGLPYESIDHPELVEFMGKRGFELVQGTDAPPSIGLFGSGCGEWLFRRVG